MRKKIGAYFNHGVGEFCVWAPLSTAVSIQVEGPEKFRVPLQKTKHGYWEGRSEQVKPGYLYRIDLDEEKQRSDPASMFQPQGVHGASSVIDQSAFEWEDSAWLGRGLSDMVIYELHVGTFTDHGTFQAIIEKLGYLKDLGINALELMPIAQFPGNRNWGYDGVFPFAAQDSYGGPEGLKALVNACHKEGIAVILDVVYNHLGPEGNYLNDFGPYFTDKYVTPWGKALNFDDAHSDEVRNFFIQNALMWLQDFHVDGLRLDAVHAIKDFGAKHFLRELSQEVEQLGAEVGRKLVLIAECDLNDPKFLNPVEQGGFGMSGQWVDEFHHALHSLVTGEQDGYYEDFGTLEHLRRAFQDSFVYSGQYSKHRKKTFGLLPENNPLNQFVVFAQNHDQVGNRMLGDRISKMVDFERLKLIAASYLLSPYIPMLFMGEEFGEEAPFMYFISHTDKDLVEAVRQGRKKEFEYFNWQGEVPDPQSEKVFNACKLNWNFSSQEKKHTLYEFYKCLLRLRKTHPSFKIFDRQSLKVDIDEGKSILAFQRINPNNEVKLCCILNFGSDTTYSISEEGSWEKLLDSSDKKWSGAGNSSQELLKEGEVIPVRKHSVLVYEKRGTNEQD